MPSSAKESVTRSAARLLVVDGHGYAYRAFFAIRRLTSPSGEPVSAIYGFIRMLAKAVEAVHPTHVLVVWDGGLDLGRLALLPGYKGQRPEMPSDLETQLDGIVAYVRAAGYSTWMRDGVEADDCIAAAAELGTKNGATVWIATSDKDFMQLVSDDVFLLGPGSEAAGFIGGAEVKSKTGVNSTQVVDWLSMIGDSVDNIPGVTGVGPKTASNLLQQYGSIEEIYRCLPQVEPLRIRRALESSLEDVRRNQRLIRLNPDVACGLSFDAFRVGQGNRDELCRLYSVWGFKTLLRELEDARLSCGDLFELPSGVRGVPAGS
jgi:DNA polymerase-1